MGPSAKQRAAIDAVVKDIRSKFNVQLGIEDQGFCVLPKAP